MRERLVETMRRRWVAGGGKRGPMRLILLATALAGFAASALMLRLGVRHMELRYPLAVLAGYLVFLVLVRVWAEVERRQFESQQEVEALLASAPSEPPLRWPSASLDGGKRKGWDWTDVIDPVFDLEDPQGCLIGLILLAVVFVLGGTIVAIGGVIGSAEVLLAEVILDGMLVAALSRRLQHLERRWWVESVLSQTIKPVVGTLLFLAIAGFVLQQLYPEAHSIGGVWREWRGH